MSKKYLTAFATLCTTLTLAHSPAFAADEPTFSDNFDSPDSLSAWTVKDNNNYASSHTSYLPENVHVDNGTLVIDSHRHCTDTADEPLTKDSIHEDPCPTGKHTRYSSGRLKTLDKIDGSQDFTVEFRAKISGDRKVGTRPALWLLRQDASYCQKVDWDATGEFDVLEWYGHRPNKSFSTSHISCQGSGSESSRKTGTKAVSQNITVDNMLNEWHTWRMDFDRKNKKATYYIDDKVINTTHFINTFTGKKINFSEDHADFTKRFDLSEDQLSKIFDHKFQIILNDWVEAKGPNVPKNSQKFPSVQFLIDSVKVYQGDRQAPNPSDTPKDEPGKDTPVDNPGKDTPVDNPGKDTPVDNPSKDTPVDKPGKDTPKDEPGKDKPSGGGSSLGSSTGTAGDTPSGDGGSSTPDSPGGENVNEPVEDTPSVSSPSATHPVVDSTGSEPTGEATTLGDSTTSSDSSTGSSSTTSLSTTGVTSPQEEEDNEVETSGENTKDDNDSEDNSDNTTEPESEDDSAVDTNTEENPASPQNTRNDDKNASTPGVSPSGSGSSVANPSNSSPQNSAVPGAVVATGGKVERSFFNLIKSFFS